MKNIPIALPYIGKEEEQLVLEVLHSGWLTQGPKVSQFESDFAKYHQVKHALAVTSCTTGLHLALATAGIGPGDEVIVPAFTWVSTANVVEHCGAKPVFCDVDSDTYTIKVEDIQSKLTEKTKAIIPVHLFGLCADIDAIREIVGPDIFILEDAACASGAIYKDRYAGSLGDMASFSFHPRKSITTGEGGMLTSNSDALAKLAETLRNHGAEIPEEVRHKSAKPYLLPDFNHLGFNYRMTDLQAAVGVVQMGRLKNLIQERQKWADFYTEKLKDIEWIKPQKIPDYISQHSWQAYVCYVDPTLAPMPRNEIMEHLQQKGVSTRPGTHAVHMLGYYKEKYGINESDFPGARDCDQNTMAIPLHNRMTEEDYKMVVIALQEIST